MPVYRLTTAETILRQYVIEAPTQAAALEQWQPRTVYNPEWVSNPETVSNPERVQHIEEDPPEFEPTL